MTNVFDQPTQALWVDNFYNEPRSLQNDAPGKKMRAARETVTLFGFIVLCIGLPLFALPFTLITKVINEEMVMQAQKSGEQSQDASYFQMGQHCRLPSWQMLSVDLSTPPQVSQSLFHPEACMATLAPTTPDAGRQQEYHNDDSTAR